MKTGGSVFRAWKGRAMMVRRFLAGMLLAGIAVPALAAAPHAHEPKAVPGALVLTMGSRVFARAEGGPDVTVAHASPEPSASPAAAASPAPAVSPAAGGVPSASPTPASLGAAEAQFFAFAAGKIDRSLYNAAANADISDAKVAQASAGLKMLGAYKDITQLERTEQPGLTIYIYRIRAANGAVQMLLGVEKTGKYTGVFFKPDQPQ